MRASLAAGLSRAEPERARRRWTWPAVTAIKPHWECHAYSKHSQHYINIGANVRLSKTKVDDLPFYIRASSTSTTSVGVSAFSAPFSYDKLGCLTP